MSQFVHVDVQSEYSLLNSIFKLNDMKKASTEMGFSGIAINDCNTMHKVFTFQQMCKKEPALQTIIGIKFIVKAMFSDTFYTLLLHAKNMQGYRNLIKLSTMANSGDKPFACLTYEDIAAYAQGLICLSSAETGELFHLILEEDKEHAFALANWCKEHFDDYYLELTNHFIPDEQKVLFSPLLKDIQENLSLPTVASNNVFYYKKEHAQHRDIGLGMNPNPEGIEYSARYVQYCNQFYYKSEAEMREAFQEILPIYPDCFDNTLKILQMCKDVQLQPQKVLPEFPIPEGYTSEEYFDYLVEEGFQKRLKNGFDLSKYTEQEYRDRLEYEKKIIKSMGFMDYHMIVQDFINWAKDGEVYQHPQRYFPSNHYHDYAALNAICYQKDFPIIVGPGRGSAAGSLVCYCLSITDRDPLVNRLLFERFLNPERVSMPDIDIDLPNQHRHLIVIYLQNKYGYANVSQIATFQTLGVRSIIKSVGKKLGISYKETDELSKNVPNTVTVTKTNSEGIEEIKEKPVELLSEIEDLDYFKEKLRGNQSLQDLFRFGKVLEGLPISTGKHAAGCIICRVPIETIVPLMEVDGVMVTQCEKHDAEDIGLLKMDLLGLLNLDIIEESFELIEHYHGVHLSIDHIPENDKKTFELFQRGDTANVFQFDGSGMRRLLKRIHPTENEHLNAACALYRPGPMQFIDDYINGRKDPASIQYPSPEFKEVTRDTFGILVYQEQVMELVQKMAGFSLGEADVLRRGIGKKEEKLLLENRKKFVEGGLRTPKLSEEKLNEIYDIICRFASYGFNRSHSCAYSWISYICGYLKANYPECYMCACLTLYSDKKEKLTQTLQEVRHMQIELLPAQIDHSRFHFSLEKQDDHFAIRYAYCGIRGVGDDVGKELESMHAGEHFADYILQFSSKNLRSNTIRNLIHAGVFDRFGARKALFLYFKQIYEDCKILIQIKEAGLASFRDQIEFPVMIEGSEYPSIEKIQYEQDVLQIALSGHVLDGIRPLVSVPYTLVDLQPENLDTLQLEGETVEIIAVLRSLRKIKTKRHEDMAFVMIEDEYTRSEGVIFPKEWKKIGESIVCDAPVLLKVRPKIRHDESGEQLSLMIEHVERIDTQSSSLYIQKEDFDPSLFRSHMVQNGVTKLYLVDTNALQIQQSDLFLRVDDALLKRLAHIPYRLIKQ